MSTSALPDAYVLGDWGTTRLRLFLMSGGAVLDRFDGPGVGALAAPPARILRQQLATWRGRASVDSVTLCGMAGARGGLVEAVYVDCPASAESWQGQQTRMLIEETRISVLPGLRHRTANGVPDVMRGEETQIFGALSLEPALAQGRHIFLLPGTHSKWAVVNDGVIEGFRTFPTGEVYALLTRHSTLTGPDRPGKGDFDQGFERGLARREEQLTSALFEARAARLLDERSRDWSQGYLSGLLIGSEVAAQCAPAEEITLIGDPALCDLYIRALRQLDCTHAVIDGETAALAGLERARGAKA